MDKRVAAIVFNFTGSEKKPTNQTASQPQGMAKWLQAGELGFAQS